MGPHVVVTIRDFPLDHSCNDNVPAEATVHPAACMAALAARFIAREIAAVRADIQDAIKCGCKFRGDGRKPESFNLFEVLRGPPT